MSPNYGKFWTQEEVHSAFAPSNETVDAVRNWLIESGVEKSRLIHTQNQGWIVFDATTKEAENLLHTKYYHYTDKVSGFKALAAEEYAPIPMPET